MYVFIKNKSGDFVRIKKEFANYNEAYYYVAEKYYNRFEDLHWNGSLTYMMLVYEKKRLLEYGKYFFKLFGIEYQIRVRENEPVRDLKITSKQLNDIYEHQN